MFVFVSLPFVGGISRFYRGTVLPSVVVLQLVLRDHNSYHQTE